VLVDGGIRQEVHATSPKAFLTEVYEAAGIVYPKFYKMDVLSQLGFLAAEFVLQGLQGYGPEDVGVVLSNANSSLDTDIRYYKSVADMPSPALFVYTLPNIVIGEICIRHGFKGENSFFVFKAFHATFIKEYVSALLADGSIQACLCGWVDVLGETYDAALFLVERAGERAFTVDNLNNLYGWIS
jgi:hypothetical protein